MTEGTGSHRSVAQYLRDTRSELRKVIWPTQDQAVNLTVVVLVVVVLMTAILGGLDYLYTLALNALMTLFGN